MKYPPRSEATKKCRVCRGDGFVTTRFCGACQASTSCDKNFELYGSQHTRWTELAHYPKDFLERYRRYHHAPFRNEKPSRPNPTRSDKGMPSSEKGVVVIDHQKEDLDEVYPDFISGGLSGKVECDECRKNRDRTIEIGQELFKIGYTMLRRAHRDENPHLYKSNGKVQGRQLSGFRLEPAKDENAESQHIIKFFRSCAEVRGLDEQIKNINKIVKDLDQATSKKEKTEHVTRYADNYRTLTKEEQQEFKDLHHLTMPAQEKAQKFYEWSSAKQIENKINAWKVDLEKKHFADPEKAAKMLEYANLRSAGDLDIFKPMAKVSKIYHDKYIDEEKMISYTDYSETVPRIHLDWAREALRISYIIFEGYECHSWARCSRMAMDCPTCIPNPTVRLSTIWRGPPKRQVEKVGMLAMLKKVVASSPSQTEKKKKE